LNRQCASVHTIITQREGVCGGAGLGFKELKLLLRNSHYYIEQTVVAQSSMKPAKSVFRVEMNELRYAASLMDMCLFHQQEINLGNASGIKAMRLTHTGEDGFVLYIPSEVRILHLLPGLCRAVSVASTPGSRGVF
jgi:hypothetical protein